MNVFRFNSCVVDPERRELTRDGELVDVQPLIFDLLLFFLENANRVVSKDDMLKAAWRSTVVSDSVVARAVMKLRRAIGDDAAQARTILTVHRIGYRFATEVRRAEAVPALLQVELPPIDLAPATRPPQGLALTAFENLSGDTTLDALLSELNHVVLHLLGDQVPLASVTASDALQAWQGMAGEPDRLASACARLRVRELAVPSVVSSEGQYAVRLLRGGDDEHARTHQFTGPDLVHLAGHVASALAGISAGASEAGDSFDTFWPSQYSRAVTLYRQGRNEPALELLQLCRHHLEPTLPMVLMQARLQVSLGMFEEARAELEAAGAMVHGEGVQTVQFERQLAMAEVAIAEGHPELGVESCLQALAALRSDPSLAAEAPKLIMRFVDALSAGDRGVEAIQLAERAVATAQRLGHRSVELSCRLGLSRALLKFRQLHRAADALRRVTEGAAQADDLLKLQALLLLSEVEQLQHRHRESIEVARQARVLARRLNPSSVARAMTLELDGLLGSGQTDEAAAQLMQRWGFDGGLDPAAPPQVVRAYAITLWRQGRGAEATRTLQEQLDSLPPNASQGVRIALASELCFMLAGSGGLQGLGPWLQPLQGTDPWLRARLEAAAALAAGQRQAALAHLSEAWSGRAGNPWDVFEVGVDLAWMLLEDGRQSELETVIAQVLEMPSDHVPVQVLQFAYTAPSGAGPAREQAWRQGLSRFRGLVRRHPAVVDVPASPLPELLTRACV